MAVTERGDGRKRQQKKKRSKRKKVAVGWLEGLFSFERGWAGVQGEKKWWEEIGNSRE